MTKRRRNDSWNKFISKNKGYYIKSKNNLFGPFKTSEIAEFFNLIAFCNPRSLNLKEESMSNIYFYEDVDKAKHPKSLNFTNSSFSNWWRDLFGTHLTNKLVIELAQESGAKGYNSFIDWLLSGYMLNGKSVYDLSANKKQ